MNIQFDSLQNKKLTLEEKVEIRNFFLKEPIKTVKAFLLKPKVIKKPKKRLWSGSR